jgi:hypothetical protein
MTKQFSHVGECSQRHDQGDDKPLRQRLRPNRDAYARPWDLERVAANGGGLIAYRKFKDVIIAA